MSPPNASAPEPGDAARRWWRSLQGEDTQGNAKPGDRAALARLRRATPASALADEATFGLFEALGYGSGMADRKRLPRVATLACLLAHVRKNASAPFGRAIGRASLSDPGSAALKPLRFQSLIVAEGEEDILRAFRRALAILDDAVDVADLARIVLRFDREETRRDLAFAYFGAGAARPQITVL